MYVRIDHVVFMCCMYPLRRSPWERAGQGFRSFAAPMARTPCLSCAVSLVLVGRMAVAFCDFHMVTWPSRHLISVHSTALDAVPPASLSRAVGSELRVRAPHGLRAIRGPGCDTVPRLLSTYYTTLLPAVADVWFWILSPATSAWLELSPGNHASFSSRALRALARHPPATPPDPRGAAPPGTGTGTGTQHVHACIHTTTTTVLVCLAWPRLHAMPR